MFAFQDNHETLMKKDPTYEESIKKWTEDLNTQKKPVRDIYGLSGPASENNLSLVREISSYLQERVAEEEKKAEEENNTDEKEVQVEKTAGDLYTDEDKKDATEEENLNLAKGKTVAKSEVQNFFAGQKVMVTGGTGFLGKVIIEKLLRSCRDVDKIYVLVRAKKGKDPVTRIQELLSDVVFKRVITENPKSIYKVVPICGDTSQPGLGLTDADRKLITDGVSIIIHSAATVRFDDPLRSAAAVNVRGTRELVGLARLCRRLQVLTHVSTAYANCTTQDLEERFYEPPMDPDNLLAISHLDESILTEITPKLLGKFPNTYTYTKAVAEQVVKKYGEGMPVCIMRPAIIVSTYEEPIRGWIDNIYGPTGALFGAGIGVLRVLWGIRDNKAELVPVDYTANAVIAATYDTAQRFQHNQTSDIPIYNFVCGEHKPISWGQFIEINKECGIKVPSMKCVWYNGFNLVSNYYVYLLYNFFLQFLPALIADTVLVIMRRRTGFLDLYRKIKRFSDVLAYFLHRQWTFHNINTRNLYSRMSNADKAIFPFDMTKMSWEYHAEMQFKGLRVYYVKDDMSTLPEATTRYRKLFIIHQVVKALAAVLAINVVYWVLYTIYKAIFE